MLQKHQLFLPFPLWWLRGVWEKRGHQSPERVRDSWETECLHRAGCVGASPHLASLRAASESQGLGAPHLSPMQVQEETAITRAVNGKGRVPLPKYPVTLDNG